MAKYVRNDSGTIHSVDDEFVTPEGWEDVDEATARAEYPELLGDTPEASDARGLSPEDEAWAQANPTVAPAAEAQTDAAATPAGDAAAPEGEATA